MKTMSRKDRKQQQKARTRAVMRQNALRNRRPKFVPNKAMIREAMASGDKKEAQLGQMFDNLTRQERGVSSDHATAKQRFEFIANRSSYERRRGTR